MISRPSIKVITTVRDFRDWRSSISQSVGFVPTMGALHDGHAALLRKARQENDFVVLSIYVNPTQFGPNEDYSKYPRTFADDIEIAEKAGVDVVFFPSNEEIYPSDFSTFVEETVLSQPLCGRFRPGHFKGVTTIVLKLFNLVQPERAYFGLKDAQQFLVIKKMVKDLNLSTQIVGVDTVREPDGLAMSSRNRYLSPESRKKAPLLYQELGRCVAALLRGERSEGCLSRSRQSLMSVGFDVQYLDLLSLEKNAAPKTRLLAVAAYLSGTRLIDNLLF